MKHSKFSENYEGQATYQITVEGKLDPTYMKSLNDLAVTHTETSDKTLSTLTGLIQDQKALSGVLNMLFDNRYPVISVMKIK